MFEHQFRHEVRDFRSDMAEKFLSLKNPQTNLLQLPADLRYRHQNSTTLQFEGSSARASQKSGEAASCVAKNDISV